MNLRHLRCFIAVAEELHFGRAARRLHVEQSPLSRTIRQLEADLGVTLLERTPRGVRLTPAGQVFLEEARRVLLTLEQAQTKARAVAAGHRGTLRIALAGGVGRTRLSALLALCREEAPEVGIRLFEAPLSQVVGGLSNDLYDAAFAMAGEMEAGVVARPVWQDPLVVAIPARHPLLAHKRVPLDEVVGYPLVLCHPQVLSGVQPAMRAPVAPGGDTAGRGRVRDDPLVDAGPSCGRLWRGIFHRGPRGGMPAGGRDRPAAGRRFGGVDDLSATSRGRDVGAAAPLHRPCSACRPYAVGYATARMRLLQAGWPMPFWSKRQTCFATAGLHAAVHGGAALRRCSRLRLASSDETRMPIMARHSEDARRNSACRMRIGSGVLS